jgi:hypothetical protein
MIAARRLAAILAANVVCFSLLLGEDEGGQRGRFANIATRPVR